MHKAIVIYGPPGAGKGTQANLLSDKLGLIHLDTGKYLESVVQDPANRTDPKIDEFRMRFDRGELLDSTWVYGIVKAQAQRIIDSGFGIAFSGSPRMYPEAFTVEDGKRGLFDFLDEKFGAENIHVILLKVKPETSIERNSHRLICSVCGTAVMYHEHMRPEFCPICGGLFRRRTLDVPETIKVRLKEYEDHTKPIFTELEKRGRKITEIDGEPLPYVVFADILNKLNLK